MDKTDQQVIEDVIRDWQDHRFTRLDNIALHHVLHFLQGFVNHSDEETFTVAEACIALEYLANWSDEIKTHLQKAKAGGSP